MRNITMIATKDHFLVFSYVDNEGEELTTSDFDRLSQNQKALFFHSIAFGTQGNTNAFILNANASNNTTDVWDSRGSVSTPFLDTRIHPDGNTVLGVVATSNDTAVVLVMPKEHSMNSIFSTHTTSLTTPEEQTRLESEESFKISAMCAEAQLRNKMTFAKIESPAVDVNPIDIDDIEII